MQSSTITQVKPEVFNPVLGEMFECGGDIFMRMLDNTCVLLHTNDLRERHRVGQRQDMPRASRPGSKYQRVTHAEFHVG